MEYEKQLEYSVPSFYHLPPPQPQPHGRKQQCKQTKHVGWNQRLVHGNQMRLVRPVCLCSWCQRGRWGRGGAGRPQGRVAAAASHVSSSSSSSSSHRKVRAVLFCDHARRERDSPTPTCACMRVVLCRVWGLNVWLLCTHTHTHTRVRAH